MTTFWLIQRQFCCSLPCCFILVPVLRYRPVIKTADSEIRKQKNIEVFQQSLAELEQDQAEEDIITVGGIRKAEGRVAAQLPHERHGG